VIGKDGFDNKDAQKKIKESITYNEHRREYLFHTLIDFKESDIKIKNEWMSD